MIGFVHINLTKSHQCTAPMRVSALSQETYEPEQPIFKRPKYDAPRTPDVFDTTWDRQTGALGQLPSEVVMRIFGFLSAGDLAVTAQACHYLASVSSQDELWKRLYFARYATGGLVPGGLVQVWFTKAVVQPTSIV